MGYQCSNYYRQLIKEGVIIDDNYFVDDNNQLSYRFKHKGVYTKKKDTRKKVEEDSDDEDESIFYYDEESVNCLPVRFNNHSLFVSLVGFYRRHDNGGGGKTNHLSVRTCAGV